jgi:putative transposase
LEIPRHFSFIELDDFVLMPNHLHGILFLNKLNHENWQDNKFGPQSQNLPSVIRGYKAAVKKYATMHQLDFSWQSRYYDRVIRSEKELQNIRSYIQNNPNKWDLDKNNPEGILM